MEESVGSHSTFVVELPSPWQPIESAPKDGTWILAYAPDTEKYWCPPAPWVIIQFSADERWVDEADSDAGEPTYWMPLLYPPKY